MREGLERLVGEMRAAGSNSGILAAQSYNQMHWTTNVNDTGYKKHGLIGMSRAAQFLSPKLHLSDMIHIQQHYHDSNTLHIYPTSFV